MNRQQDLRRHSRTAKQAAIRMSWEDGNGSAKFTMAWTVDVSLFGARIQSGERIPANAIVTMQSERLGLHGAGRVRYVENRGIDCFVGVEFVGGLRM